MRNYQFIRLRRRPRALPVGLHIMDLYTYFLINFVNCLGIICKLDRRSLDKDYKTI
jgi:hypothetical protein